MHFLNLFLPIDGWIGLYQDVNDPNYSEPSGGWKWVDGSPLLYKLESEPTDNAWN